MGLASSWIVSKLPAGVTWPAFLAPAFLAPAFLAPAFLAPAFLAPAFLAPAFLAGAALDRKPHQAVGDSHLVGHGHPFRYVKRMVCGRADSKPPARAGDASGVPASGRAWG